MRAILWIWLGILPPLALFAGMYMLPGIPPSYGNPPWSPIGGDFTSNLPLLAMYGSSLKRLLVMFGYILRDFVCKIGIIGGVAAVVIGMAAVYNVHEPSSDCDHSGI